MPPMILAKRSRDIESFAGISITFSSVVNSLKGLLLFVQLRHNDIPFTASPVVYEIFMRLEARCPQILQTVN
jgi:hypothetical protein